MAREDLIQFRRGTAAEWAATGQTLEDGEPGFVADESALIIGDGTTQPENLPRLGAGVDPTGDTMTGPLEFDDGADVTISIRPDDADNSGYDAYMSMPGDLEADAVQLYMAKTANGGPYGGATFLGQNGKIDLDSYAPTVRIYDRQGSFDWDRRIELNGESDTPSVTLYTGDAFGTARVTINGSATPSIDLAAGGTYKVAGTDILSAVVAKATFPVCIGVAMSDETTAITTGTAKVTIRAPFAFTLTGVRASVNTVSSSGVVTVDINEAGTTVLSTKLTIDASELTSTTAATAAVISDSAIADDAELTFDIDTAGTGAKGLKVWLIGTRSV